MARISEVNLFVTQLQAAFSGARILVVRSGSQFLHLDHCPDPRVQTWELRSEKTEDLVHALWSSSNPRVVLAEKPNTGGLLHNIVLARLADAVLDLYPAGFCYLAKSRPHKPCMRSWWRVASRPKPPDPWSWL